MRVLVAEDDPVSLRILETLLRGCGHAVTACADGSAALAALEGSDSPALAILDWMMPGLDGVEVCRRARQKPGPGPLYIIILTAKLAKQDLVAALAAGADDYVTKPFDRDELQARVQVGVRVMDLQSRLAQRARELEEALSLVKQLQGLLPICSYCKKIRDDRNYWQGVESYVTDHSEARFSHGICPDCYEKIVTPQLQETAEPE